ncbi:MAG: hypothetical protein ACFFG0_07800, partial [Candidatus Thorarchaeota archaeon]
MNEFNLFNMDFLLFLEDNLNEYKDSVNLIITDPPFGVEYNQNVYDDNKEYVFNNIDKWIEGLSLLLSKNSHCYIYVPTLELDVWIYHVKKYLKYNNLLTLPNLSEYHKKSDNNFNFV